MLDLSAFREIIQLIRLMVDFRDLTLRSFKDKTNSDLSIDLRRGHLARLRPLNVPLGLLREVHVDDLGTTKDPLIPFFSKSLSPQLLLTVFTESCLFEQKKPGE